MQVKLDPGRHAARAAAVAPGDTRPAPTLEPVAEALPRRRPTAALARPPPLRPRRCCPRLPSRLREALPETLSEPPPREAPRAVVRATRRRSRARVTPAAAFDAVEADFFAREADLYKREAVETFDDLDPGGSSDPRVVVEEPPQAPSSARRDAALRKYYTAPSGRSGIYRVRPCAPHRYVVGRPSVRDPVRRAARHRLQQRQPTDRRAGR